MHMYVVYLTLFFNNTVARQKTFKNGEMQLHAKDDKWPNNILQHFV